MLQALPEALSAHVCTDVNTYLDTNDQVDGFSEFGTLMKKWDGPTY